MNYANAGIPAHVPRELVRDDYPFLMGVTTTKTPFTTFVPELHEGPEIFYSSNTIMPGDKIALPTTLANTDPAAWEKPFEVDFNRNPRHLTFASGIHRCLGAPLARRESAIALEELLTALPQFRIKEGAELVTALGPILQPVNLPLVW